MDSPKLDEYDQAELAVTLFEESGDALFLFEPQSEAMVDVNPLAQKLSGWTRPELLAMQIDYLFRSEIQGGLVRLRQAWRKTGPFHAQDGFLLRTKRSAAWVPVNLSVARLHTRGRTLGLITARDVTEQKQAQLQLRHKEAELRDVLSSVSDCLWSADLFGADSVQMRYCSPVVQQLTGLPADHFTKGPARFVELTHPEDQLVFRNALRRLQDRVSQREEIEIRFVRPESSGILWVRCSITARPEGEHLRLTGVLSDITEIIQRREELQMSEARCRSLLENLEQSIFLKDAELRFTAVNRRFCISNNASEEELIGKDDFAIYPAELAMKYRADDVRVLREGVRIETEEQTLVSGMLRWVRVIKIPLRDAMHRTVGVVGIFWDVTEQRVLEEQLRQAGRLEAVGRLAGGVAHDFNNLLTAILGNLSLLRLTLVRTDVSPTETIDAIEKAAWRAADLTRQLLGFSRRMVMRAEHVDLNRIIQEVVQLVQPIVDPRIRVEFIPRPQECSTIADPGQLTQAVINLAYNARDALLEVLDTLAAEFHGKIRLSCDPVTLTPQNVPIRGNRRFGNFVRLTVEDNGCGMSPEVVERIYEPFFTTKSQDRGTGLGLALVFGIVQQHQGWIECHSQPGRGTTFEIYLPGKTSAVSE
jgi:PAS domain S-box-containing protein